MEIDTSRSFDHQEGLVVIVGKKTAPIEGIPSGIQEELSTFSKENKKELRHIEWKKKHYFFINEQKTSEDYRVLGHQIRSKLPVKAESILFHGPSKTSLLVAEGFLLSNYQFIHYRKEAEKETHAIQHISFTSKPSETTITELLALVKAVTWARDLVNEPVSFLTATQLAKEIELKGKEADFSVTILEKSKIEALKMGGLLAVNKGSIEPPTFTIIEYKPKKAFNKKPIILVGKGVVYDTGGLSLKPTAGSMDLMKSDMAGAACMAGTIYAAAQMELPVYLIGLIPSTDNRPGLNAYAPGDVITMYDGTTVEVLNTDAEGRMILADALAYSNKWKPELVIDAATLTGAAVRAIGTKASIVMGNADKKYFDLLTEAGVETHERVVEFPFWDDYFEEMKSKIADLNNLGGGTAGMITAGKFLEHFVKAPYIHIDIAGPAFLERAQDYKGLGGTGVGIRLLINFLKRLS